MLINTVFCAQLSQIEFPHAYARLLHPASATKLTFEATWKMSNFRISFFFEKLACRHSGKNHCGNFRSSAPQPPRNVNGQTWNFKPWRKKCAKFVQAHSRKPPPTLVDTMHRKKGKDSHPQDKIQHLDFTKDPRPLYYKTPPCVFYHKNARSKAVLGPYHPAEK